MSKPQSKKKLIAFPWYGGKFSKLGFILPQIPSDTYHFVDVYGGSAAVLLNAGPYPIETYNDLDSEIVNFFDVLRTQKVELIEAIKLTPYSREEFERAYVFSNTMPKLERARRFYIRARQSVAGKAQRKTSGGWCFKKTDSRGGMSGQCSAWLNSIPKLHKVAERFKRVQIDNGPALKILERYDTDRTVFYVDPPYVHSSRTNPRCYKFEMTDKDHESLAHVLNDLDGRVVLSGYRSPLYDKLFSDWKRVDFPQRAVSVAVNKKNIRMTQECVWKNFG